MLRVLRKGKALRRTSPRLYGFILPVGSQRNKEIPHISYPFLRMASFHFPLRMTPYTTSPPQRNASHNGSFYPPSVLIIVGKRDALRCRVPVRDVGSVRFGLVMPIPVTSSPLRSGPAGSDGSGILSRHKSASDRGHVPGGLLPGRLLEASLNSAGTLTTTHDTTPVSTIITVLFYCYYYSPCYTQDKKKETYVAPLL